MHDLKTALSRLDQERPESVEQAARDLLSSQPEVKRLVSKLHEQERVVARLLSGKHPERRADNACWRQPRRKCQPRRGRGRLGSLRSGNERRPTVDGDWEDCSGSTSVGKRSYLRGESLRSMAWLDNKLHPQQASCPEGGSRYFQEAEFRRYYGNVSSSVSGGELFGASKPILVRVCLRGHVVYNVRMTNLNRAEREAFDVSLAKPVKFGGNAPPTGCIRVFGKTLPPKTRSLSSKSSSRHLTDCSQSCGRNETVRSLLVRRYGCYVSRRSH